MVRKCDTLQDMSSCTAVSRCKWDMRYDFCREKTPKADYGTIVFLLILEVVALFVFRFVMLHLAGFDLFDFEKEESKWIGGFLAAMTLLWVIRMISSGGTHSIGKKVLQSDPNSNIKELHKRVMKK